ncbi:acetyltransferase [Paenibacillus rigui]|uniref:Acetyltransferase n=1 Tax=Paenibacillus rigui TaxID=554312 RepID=A0A229UP89_9BACL|nr:acetyltransferase [Paenibacillus rigui]OXM85232.1 acetyltransferase [Paenibacillus rigui]
MQIAVIGNGGHSKVVTDLIRSIPGYRIQAILDDKYEAEAQDGDVCTGPLSCVPGLLQSEPELRFIVAVGHNATRQTIVSRLGLPADRYITLVHPSAVVSPSATLGRGTVVMAHAVVQADTAIGHHAIVNSGAIIEHDSRLDDYVHAAPRATLTGAVSVGEGAMIGAGAVVIPGKSIGAWAVVGAGAAVIGNIPPHSTAVGTPAKLLIR